MNNSTDLKEWVQPQIISISKSTVEGGGVVGGDYGPDNGYSTQMS